MVETRHDGLQIGDFLFHGREPVEVEMAQQRGAGEVGNVAGSPGAAGVLENTVFVPAKAEDYDAVSRIGKHWTRGALQAGDLGSGGAVRCADTIAVDLDGDGALQQFQTDDHP